jgi:hypothetical protein
VVTGIDVERFAGDARRETREEEEGGVRDLLGGLYSTIRVNKYLK